MARRDCLTAAARRVSATSELRGAAPLQRCIAAPSRPSTSPAHQLPSPSPQVSSHGSCHSRTAQVGACLSPPAHRARMRHRRAERRSCHCRTASERQHGGRRGRDEAACAPDARLAVAPLCARMPLRCPAQPSVPLIASGECSKCAQRLTSCSPGRHLPLAHQAQQGPGQAACPRLRRAPRLHPRHCQGDHPRRRPVSGSRGRSEGRERESCGNRKGTSSVSRHSRAVGAGPRQRRAEEASIAGFGARLLD
jgi:hypothetical protein